MLLVLTPSEGERKLWVTRRLWLALYREVAPIAPATAEEPTPPPAVPARPIAPEDTSTAVPLLKVQIKRQDAGTTLLFTSPQGATKLTMREAGLARFKRMLEVQADRAGWDAPAAMERLRAESMAGAAVQRAKQ